MSVQFLTADGGGWKLGDYVPFNNTWGKGTLQNGIDYTQTLTLDTSGVGEGVTFNWSWPTSNGYIVAYPEIAWGDSPLYDGIDECHDYVSQIFDLKTFTVDMDISLAAGSSYKNVSFDLWLTDKPVGDQSSITTEVMIWLDNDKTDVWGEKIGILGSGRDRATVYQASGYVAVVYDKPHLSGEIDLSAILNQLGKKGIISAADYISGYHLGAELTGGSGQMTINGLNTHFEGKQAEVPGDYDNSSQTGLVINATPTSNKYVGTSSFDFVSYEKLSGKVNVSLTDTSIGRSLGTSDVFESIEGLFGGERADVFRGDSGDNAFYGRGGMDVLRGGVGADIVYGERGRDRLNGGAGDDILAGGAGADHLSGGAGFDIATYATAKAAVHVDMTGVTAKTGDAYGDVFVSIEAIQGSAYSDTLIGDSRNNVFWGDEGDDILVGGGGKDTFHFAGNFGNDVIDDFNVGAGANDIFDLSLGSNFDTFEEVRNAITQSGSNTTIDFGSGRSVTLLGMHITDIALDNFTFSV